MASSFDYTKCVSALMMNFVYNFHYLPIEWLKDNSTIPLFELHAVIMIVDDFGVQSASMNMNRLEVFDVLIAIISRSNRIMRFNAILSY
ncbi:hypothetical protein BLOT_000268 [Blomia tropicalis]|nr:hypothetical protein BLOT_000268 [Blomia tropicalis]